MKIALLHYTTWPDFGGVENVLRHQAILLLRQGHEVLVISGRGDDPYDGYAFACVPEMSSDYPLHEQTRKVLDTGQFDQNFNKYRQLLVETLKPYLAEVEVTFVHNCFTMHLNLALTQALHELSSNFPMVAWTHDLTTTNPDHSLPNPEKAPWNLVKTAPPNVHFVTTSDQRRAEIEEHVKPTPDVRIIPNIVDIGQLFNLSVEMRESLDALALAERDFVFLLPAKIIMRKNIEFAVELVAELKKQGRNPLLLITGVPDTHSVAAAQYGKFVRDTLPDDLKRFVVFVNDFFPVDDWRMRDLYALSDCLLYPSRHEGFGLPILEAALHRLPIWCNSVPAYWDVEGEGAFMINNVAQLSDAVEWLESQPTFRTQRKVRSSFDTDIIYQKHYKPLLETVVS